MIRCFIYSILLTITSSTLIAAETISYQRDVWPILKRHCWGCHSTGKNAKGGLSINSLDAMLKGGDTGPALVASKPDESLLIEMISGQDPEMPLKAPPLSPAKIAVLRQWIQQGAKVDASPAAQQIVILIPETYHPFAPPGLDDTFDRLPGAYAPGYLLSSLRD